MSMVQTVETIPLLTDSDGVVRVGGTRVPLETVIEAFDAGATPEEIAQDFPVLRLDDLYAVITYYLRHREQVGTYLEERHRKAQAVRQKCAQRFDQAGLRERLMARLESA